MNLFYYQDARGNFGDELNPLIWYSLYPELFLNQDDSETVVGIGTLINDRAPRTGTLHVLGSGVGYHGRIKDPERWRFHFVRGPLSAQALGLDPQRALTDPAILIKRIFRADPTLVQPAKVGFMPHHASIHFADWRAICEAAGLMYLDPGDDVATTIHRIRTCRLVVAEAMHAAIVADALRVPWVAVKAYPQILDFKWDDWCQSVQLQYAPITLESVWDMEREQSEMTVFKSNVKRKLMSLGMSGKHWTPPLPVNNRREVAPRVIEALIGIKALAGTLSPDAVHGTLLDRVDEAIRNVIVQLARPSART